MVGYGPEDSHFVVELTYNYNISSYRLGNDFQGITIQSSECLERAKTAGWPVRTDQGRSVLEAPGGYKFFIIPSPRPSTRDPVLRRYIQQSIGANTRTFTCQLSLPLCHKEPAETSKISQVGGSGCDELVLYGIRLLA